ncbi:LysR family transcriptional regulator [Alteromonas facilis]|uniref:LysR family transcriptional regulator n=1 Tax=Alteromonas facilis TaxID=2048004 RepID=UPI000C293AC5|nr:LysR family transcriptional regulator [Alteromonas facilis]
MLDRFTSMRIFIDALDLGSLSASARAQNISPAMAARHIDALEQRLGVKLLHRSTRQLIPTSAGQRFLESSQHILNEVIELESDITSRQEDISGVVNINAPHTFGYNFVSPLIPSLLNEYPNLSVNLHLNDSVKDMVTEGWDLTIRVGHLSDSDLRARCIGQSKMYVCASPQYWLANGKPSRIQELAQYNCLSYTLSPTQANGKWMFGVNGEIAVPVKGNFTSNNGESLMLAATMGLGVIYQPEFVVQKALNSGTLEAIPLNEPPVNLGGIHVLFAGERKMPAKVRATIDFLVAQFQ